METGMDKDCIGCMTDKRRCFCEAPDRKLEYPEAVPKVAREQTKRK